MTLAELERAIDSKRRIKKRQEQELASHNYILADLIGKSLARVYSSANKMPDITEVYPTLFDTKEIKQRKQKQMEEISALRFKQFAQSYNKKFEEVGNKNE